MAERKLTYFVSDVHLGLNVNDPTLREQQFVKFLRFLDNPSTEALYMLGDIWDFWYEYHDVVPKGYVRVFAALMDLIDKGIKVYFIPGNHDIWCYHYFHNMGITIIEQPCVIEIEGKTLCLGHGDGLGPGHKWYKLMRWIFHNPVFQNIFSLLHPYLAFRIGKGWSKKSRVAKKVEYCFKGEQEPLYIFAEDFSRKRKIDYFIFGHYHVSEHLTLPSGSQFYILKDWMTPEKANYLYFDGISVRSGYSANIE